MFILTNKADNVILEILVYNVQWTKSGDLINDIGLIFKS